MCHAAGIEHHRRRWIQDNNEAGMNESGEVTAYLDLQLSPLSEAHAGDQESARKRGRLGRAAAAASSKKRPAVVVLLGWLVNAVEEMGGDAGGGVATISV